jgi:hypothetical protein
MRDALNEYFGNMIDMLSGHGADIVKFAGKARCPVRPLQGLFMRETHAPACIRRHQPGFCPARGPWLQLCRCERRRLYLLCPALPLLQLPPPGSMYRVTCTCTMEI